MLFNILCNSSSATYRKRNACHKCGNKRNERYDEHLHNEPPISKLVGISSLTPKDPCDGENCHVYNNCTSNRDIHRTRPHGPLSSRGYETNDNKSYPDDHQKFSRGKHMNFIWYQIFKIRLRGSKKRHTHILCSRSGKNSP